MPWQKKTKYSMALQSNRCPKGTPWNTTKLETETFCELEKTNKP